jgi:hypothetical protein
MNNYIEPMPTHAHPWIIISNPWAWVDFGMGMDMGIQCRALLLGTLKVYGSYVVSFSLFSIIYSTKLHVFGIHVCILYIVCDETSMKIRLKVGLPLIQLWLLKIHGC